MRWLLIVGLATLGGCHWVLPHRQPGGPVDARPDSQDRAPPDREETADRPVDTLPAPEQRDLVAPRDVLAAMEASAKEASAKEASAKEGGPVGSCGNSLLEAGEVCDDGNLLAGDLCSPDCKAIDFACAVDHVTKGTIAGLLVDTDDFVPLCDGWILLGDRQTKSIVLRKPPLSLVQRTYSPPSLAGWRSIGPRRSSGSRSRGSPSWRGSSSRARR
jgi:cysteine-rich repeat protein